MTTSPAPGPTTTDRTTTDRTPADRATPPRTSPSDRLLHGRRGQEVWRRELPGAGKVTAHVVDPDGDLDVLHAWVTARHAGFWGLADLDREELRATYAFVDALPTHEAYLLRWDGEPVALVQLYHPEDDPVAAAYEVREGDLGLHFFKGGDGPAAAHGVEPWSVVGPAALGFALAAPGTRRLVVEPDARNRAAVARMVAFGFEPAGTVRFTSPHGPKEAVLAFCGRERGLEIAATHAASTATAGATERTS
ncbi:acetyltransferase [Isoptericola sp. NEAU-Y5]|uniref:Lysine N-acyltransferase MbtK n=1 Tax=Isoptericola luteus TaxID=2879484 RepID=A0ABS7ZCC9_9MICO|nr:GNAT family N-acetyltransferase [Isoptericola sp. NEAU-Y5]MCA5892705.1 acetyltransferase [Isoptericola sp. NEAU-Y5]